MRQKGFETLIALHSRGVIIGTALCPNSSLGPLPMSSSPLPPLAPGILSVDLYRLQEATGVFLPLLPTPFLPGHTQGRQNKRPFSPSPFFNRLKRKAPLLVDIPPKCFSQSGKTSEATFTASELDAARRGPPDRDSSSSPAVPPNR